MKTLGAGGLGIAASSLMPSFRSFAAGDRAKKEKYWAWVSMETRTSDDDWKKHCATMRQSGIDAILPEIYNSRRACFQSKRLPVAELWLDRLLPLAKAEGLEVHAWMWSMPCNIPDVRKDHPEWFVVNRKGVSAAEKPAYVDYYRFLCPSRPEACEFVRANVAELSRYEGLDGVHLDYIRFPDVILPDALQPRYGIHQDREYPEYDYCYCDACCSDFKKETGIDIRTVDDPTTSKEWFQFRCDRITHLVNNLLVPTAHENKKQVTAAVFPNWHNVRQQWPAWNADGVLPMLYHGFYNKGIDWIGEQTAQGVRSLSGRMPLYSGLFVPQMNPSQLAEAIDVARKNGAGGVSLFSSRMMSPAHWESFRKAVKKEE